VDKISLYILNMNIISYMKFLPMIIHALQLSAIIPKDKKLINRE